MAEVSEVRPGVVIVGEPTDMTVVNAHKGIASHATSITGLEAHSSQTHRGVNAIEVAAELIGVLGRLGEEMKQRGDPHGRFDPPYTTVHVGTIQGGTAQNIIPRRCVFTWEYRAIPRRACHRSLFRALTGGRAGSWSARLARSSRGWGGSRWGGR